MTELETFIHNARRVNLEWRIVRGKIIFVINNFNNMKYPVLLKRN